MALPVELESNNHSVFLMHYHLVLVVKYRRRVITDAVSDRAREIFERIAPTYGITLEEWNHDVAYRNFFRRVKAGEKPGFPKYKAKHRSRYCYKTNFVNGNIRFEGDGRYLRLPKLGSVRVRQKREIDPSWRIKSVTVEHTRSGRFEGMRLALSA